MSVPEDQSKNLDQIDVPAFLRPMAEARPTIFGAYYAYLEGLQGLGEGERIAVCLQGCF